MTAQVLQVHRRAVTPRDAGFLRDRFAELRDDLLVLPPDSRDVIVDMQFRAARRQQDLDHPTANREILVAGGAAVGVLVVDAGATTAQIVNLSVRSSMRGRGIGSAVLGEVLGDARAAGQSVRIRVWSASPRTRRFYERHGFRQAGTAAGYDHLHWQS